MQTNNCKWCKKNPININKYFCSKSCESEFIFYLLI